MTRLSIPGGSLCLAAVLSLCTLGAALAQQASTAVPVPPLGQLLNEVDPAEGFTSVERSYPSMDRVYSRDGTVTAADDLGALTRGQSRSQLVGELGQPAVAFGDGSWEFHLSLPLTGQDRLICQYRVFFDADDLVERGVWRRPQCAALWPNG